tara:strand:+ start:240 stop:1475 length:1236 start_codon:yes stop_codon:yes gene_type:complete
MYFLYNTFLFIFVLISPIIIFFRILIGKENPTRFKEKYCFFSQKSKTGKKIWIHGASVGEILSIIPIIKKYEKNKSIKQILITSSTLSSSLVLAKYKFKKTTHQFFPIDFKYFSKKFIEYWKPSVSIFVDSEIWPNMIFNLSKKKIPIIILNARFTKKSFKRWKYFSKSSKNIFNKISMAIPQNSETSKYLKTLGVKNIRAVNNLKFFGDRFSNKINSNFKKKFANRDIWCAASTHDGEELEIAKIHNKIKLKNNKLLTILIPRHVNRKKLIIKIFNENNLNFVTHSSGKSIKKNTDIYLVDVYGEALKFYNLTKISFIGGSLVNHGGQNPLEAARLGNLILHGPYIDNFKEVYRLIKNLDLSHKISKASQIEKYLIKNINYSRENKKTNKLYIIGKKILENNINELKKYT